MRLNEVIDRFALISGLPADEVSIWTPVCVDAMCEVEAKALDTAVKDERTSRKLSNLAGVLAYYKYCLYSYRNVQRFEAGSVSVTISGETLEFAKKLWEEEKNSAVDCLKAEGDFFFKRVRL